jgi:hypothetical protein
MFNKKAAASVRWHEPDDPMVEQVSSCSIQKIHRRTPPFGGLTSLNDPP